MRDQLLKHGFKETRIPNEFIKRKLNVRLKKDSILITHYCQRARRLIWTETYYNFDYFEKYLIKEHQTN